MNKNKKNKEMSVKKSKNTIKNIIIVICVFTIISSIGMFFLITNKLQSGTFTYSKHLDEIILTVEESEISLKEISYYILVAETNYNEAALAYDSDNPEALWNLNLNPDMSWKLFSDVTKDEIMEACKRDNIYYQEALKQGYTLNEEESEKIKNQAVEEMNKLTDSQIEVIDYELKDMVNALTKVYYAKNYVQKLMKEGYEKEELDIGGSKYEEIRETYLVKVNEELWNVVKVGKITINNS